MQAIVTKFLPATNFRGSRIKAECERGSVTISADSALSGEDSHLAAVKELVARFVKEDSARYASDPKKNPWLRPLVCGGLPKSNSHSYAFVFTS